MADKLDVAGRLGEGREPVENVQDYVWASHLLDYQNPDLTLHSAQVRDWFGTEDGLDLPALDADRSAFDAVAAVADEVLWVQRGQVEVLATAWSGTGAQVATDFVRRHCVAAASVAASARTAAHVLAALRDNLWGMVDGKVAAVTSIDDRRQGERPAWLSASQTVITGTGDRAAASELVNLQVKPFVDNDIRVDWLNAVRATIASIADSYDAANAALTSLAPVRFEIPGDLGPAWSPPVADTPTPAEGTAAGSSAPAGPVGAPAVGSTPPAAPPPAAPPTAAPMAAAVPAAPPAAAPPAPVPPATAPSAAMPELPGLPVGGLTGLGQGLADALGGLMSSRDQVLPEPPAADPSEPEVDEPSIGDALADGADATDPEDDPADPPDERVEPEPAAVEPESEPESEPAPPAAPPAEPPPAPLSAPPADEPSTPCEIAADKLPQVGQ